MTIHTSKSFTFLRKLMGLVIRTAPTLETYSLNSLVSFVFEFELCKLKWIHFMTFDAEQGLP